MFIIITGTQHLDPLSIFQKPLFVKCGNLNAVNTVSIEFQSSTSCSLHTERTLTEAALACKVAERNS